MRSVKRWVPENGDVYYSIRVSSSNGIYKYTWEDDLMDRNALKSGNYFSTKRRAEEKLDKIKKILKDE